MRSAFAVAKRERLGRCERHAVERPHEALHVAREMQLDRALGLAAVGIGEQRAQVGVGQHAPAVVAQADAGIREPRLGRRRLHVDAGVALFAGGMQRRCHCSQPCLAVLVSPPVRRVARMIGARRGGSVHAVAHVGHRQIDDAVELRHGSGEPVAYRERAARVTRAVERLREDRERVRARGRRRARRTSRPSRCGTRRRSRDGRSGRRLPRRSSAARESARRRSTSPSR